MASLPRAVMSSAFAPGGGGGGILDLESKVARDVTFVVSVKGDQITSFSIDLRGALVTPDQWFVFQTVTEPGAYTFNTHWARYFSAELTAISGASFPTDLVNVSVVAVPPAL